MATVTWNHPANIGPIGPGFNVQVQLGIVGPIAVDDYVDFFLTGGTVNKIVEAKKITGGFPDVFATLGVTADHPIVDFTSEYVAPGTAVVPNAQWYHANGVFVAQAAYAGAWTFDPTSGLWSLVTGLFKGGGSASLLTQILSAVKRTYTN